MGPNGLLLSSLLALSVVREMMVPYAIERLGHVFVMANKVI